MDQDNFRETIIRQYKNEIHEIYLETAHHNKFSAPEFNEKLKSIWASAKLDGVTETEFYYLVEEAMPESFDQVVFPFPKAA